MAEPIRVYADTSVFGGVFDPEFRVASQRFFELVRQGRLQLVVSLAVQREVEAGPADVGALFQDLLPVMELIETPATAFRLQEAYIVHGVVSAKQGTDALHVAVATVMGCAMIVSWNFRHIVSFRRIPLYNAVNCLNGYHPVAIYSPLEVVNDEEEELRLR